MIDEELRETLVKLGYGFEILNLRRRIEVFDHVLTDFHDWIFDDRFQVTSYAPAKEIARYDDLIDCDLKNMLKNEIPISADCYLIVDFYTSRRPTGIFDVKDFRLNETDIFFQNFEVNRGIIILEKKHSFLIMSEEYEHVYFMRSRRFHEGVH